MPSTDDIVRVMTGYDEAKESKKYADSLKLEAENISGNNYCLVWSTAYNGGFKPDAER